MTAFVPETQRATRAVVVGSGSAGRRHAAALRTALPRSELFVVRRPDSRQPMDVLQELGASVVPSLDPVLTSTVDVAIVAGPAPFHASAALALIRTGARVLVEKPLAASISDAVEIRDRADALGTRLVVGYHLRYSDVVPHLRSLIAGGSIGAPIRFHFAVGQHLGQWRPGTDPRESVTARRDLGGGVLLELSHELDGALFVLGEHIGDVDTVEAALGFTGAPTDGMVETVADLELSGTSGLHGTIHLDMVSAVPHRRWEVTGTEGTLVADLLSGVIERRSPPGNDLVFGPTPPGERDRAEVRLIDDLLAVEPTAPQRCGGDDGVAAVELVAAARSSADLGQPVPVRPARQSAP